jgi:hypothetical protein
MEVKIELETKKQQCLPLASEFWSVSRLAIHS